MSTSIEWTGETWNPIRALNPQTGKIGWHCEKVSPGCKHCYAERINRSRWTGHGTGLAYVATARDMVDIFLDATKLEEPLRWRSQQRVFVCSMTDLFADFVPIEFIDMVWAVMAVTPHSYQALTKRSRRLRGWAADPDTPGRVSAAVWKLSGSSKRAIELPSRLEWPLANVHVGVSAEDQPRADERLDDLMDTPAAVRFVSYEPALGPVNWRRWLSGKVKLDWGIIGGESGPGASMMHLTWARSTIEEFGAAGTAVFMKQAGSFAVTNTESESNGGRLVSIDTWKVATKDKKGGNLKELPEDLRVREFPREAQGAAVASA